MLGCDRQRRPRRREDSDVGRGRDEEGDELGDGPDQVLAVVEHEQTGRLCKLLSDARADISALLGTQRTPCADRIPDAERRADLADDILGRTDADELDDVHDRKRRILGEHMGEPGLAEPARPDDRHDARRGEEPAQAREVVVAAEQRSSGVAQAAADRLVEGEQLPLNTLQRLARVHPESVAQVTPIVLEALQRRRRTAERRLRGQQIGQQRLVGRMRGERGDQRLERLRMPARPAQSSPEDQRRLGGVVPGTATEIVEGTRVVLSLVEQPADQCDRLARERRGAACVTVELDPGLPHEPGKPEAVDLGRLNSDPVADRVADDHVLAAGAASPRNEHLQALSRVRGDLITPNELDQLLAANRTSLTGRKRRQQRTRTLPDNGHPPPADVIQKRKHDPHVVSLRSAHGQPASTPPPRRPASEVHLQTPISRLSD